MNLDRIPSQSAQDETLHSMGAQSARTKHVKRTHGHHRRAGLAVVGLHKMFTGKLGNGVAPARLDSGPDPRRRILMHTERIDAKDLTGGKVDEAFESPVFVESLQDSRST